MKKQLKIAIATGILGVAMLTGCGNATNDATDTEAANQEEAGAEVSAPAPIEVDMASYDTIISSLPEGYHYAFADIDKDKDALLVADSESVFEDLDGNKNAKAARIYGYDNAGNIKEYGYVESGSTANPLAVKDGKLYYASHDMLKTAYIDEESAELVLSETESFDDYDNVTVVVFTPAGGSEKADE